MVRQAHRSILALMLVAALGLGAAGAVADVPARPQATPAEIAQAKRVLEERGYRDIAVRSSDDQLVTLSAMKDGAPSVLDVDPLTQIVLPHADLPPLPSVTGTGRPR